MHLLEIQFFPENYPTSEAYPFHLPVFQKTRRMTLSTPVTFMAGENGTGKSTLLRALCNRCGIHIWEDEPGKRTQHNPHEENLYQHIKVQWTDKKVPGSFFRPGTHTNHRV